LSERLRTVGQSVSGEYRRLRVGIERGEVEAEVRVVERTKRFVVFCPYAPTRMFETWIAPVNPAKAFVALPGDELAELALLLKRTLARVRTATNGADYNLVWRSPPTAARGSKAAFWALEILPRTGGDAGFELATSTAIVTFPPERAADALRRSG
jgi:UDPglucose--hexose-1-phosphate uridylyltransferase